MCDTVPAVIYFNISVYKNEVQSIKNSITQTVLVIYHEIKQNKLVVLTFDLNLISFYVTYKT